MRLVVKLLVVLCVSSLAVFADPLYSVTFNGLEYLPTGGVGSFPVGSAANACSGLSGCIIGVGTDIAFEPVTVTLTENYANNWTYTEQTYTPNSLTEGSSTFGSQAFGDALFYDTTTQTYWGIALDTLDGLTQGGLYYAGTSYENAFLLPSQVGATGGSDPVLINNPNNSGVGPTGFLPNLASSGDSFSVVTDACYVTACGVSGGYSLYTITDTFTVNSPTFSFLGDPDPFDFEVASYVCSNGVILGSSSGVPEPRGLVFIGAALLLLAGRFARPRAKAAA